MNGIDPDPSDRSPAAWRRWHDARLRSLRADDGWLTLAGLHFLEDGVFTAGRDPSNRIHLPSAPLDRLGAFLVEGDRVTFAREPNPLGGERGVTIDGRDVDTAELRADDAGGPSLVRAGPLSLALLRRNGRLAVRVRDNASSLRRDFVDFPLYEFDERWVLVGQVVPAGEEWIEITNVTGFVERQRVAGRIRVALPSGDEHELVATAGSAPGSLFVVFADRTNGRDGHPTTTYPGGRFLSIEAPRGDGSVIVDFNRAHNPVCAFSPFATCPTPPPCNRLPIAVEAGERYPHRTAGDAAATDRKALA